MTTTPNTHVHSMTKDLYNLNNLLKNTSQEKQKYNSFQLKLAYEIIPSW